MTTHLDVDGYFRFTKWLPAEAEIDGQRVMADSDLSGWIRHFQECGIDTRIRTRTEDGKISLWREGRDAFDRDEED